MIDVRDRAIRADRSSLSRHIVREIAVVDIQRDVFFDMNSASERWGIKAHRSIAERAIVVEQAILDLDQLLGRIPWRGIVNSAADITRVVILENAVRYLELRVIAINTATGRIRAMAGQVAAVAGETAIRDRDSRIERGHPAAA